MFDQKKSPASQPLIANRNNQLVVKAVLIGVLTLGLLFAWAQASKPPFSDTELNSILQHVVSEPGRPSFEL